MDIISKIFAFSKANAISKKSDIRKTQLKNESTPKSVTNLNYDKAELSADARRLFGLQTEALRFLNSIRNANIIDEKDIQEINNKLKSGFYSNSEIINIVSNKLVKLPNFIS